MFSAIAPDDPHLCHNPSQKLTMILQIEAITKDGFKKHKLYLLSVITSLVTGLLK